MCAEITWPLKIASSNTSTTALLSTPSKDTALKMLPALERIESMNCSLKLSEICVYNTVENMGVAISWINSSPNIKRPSKLFKKS